MVAHFRTMQTWQKRLYLKIDGSIAAPAVKLAWLSAAITTFYCTPTKEKTGIMRKK